MRAFGYGQRNGRVHYTWGCLPQTAWSGTKIDDTFFRQLEAVSQSQASLGIEPDEYLLDGQHSRLKANQEASGEN